jgi:hypothetical protein
MVIARAVMTDSRSSLIGEVVTDRRCG